MNKLNFIYNRKSVRKFAETQIDINDLKDIIRAAGAAPSGTNSQNWHYVAITNKEKISSLANIVIKKNTELQDSTISDKAKYKLNKFLHYATLFKNAPTVIVAFASEYSFLKDTDLEGFEDADKKAIKFSNPAMQNLGASIENLCLSAAALGYGTCWMTAPCYAYNEISNFLGMGDSTYNPVAIIPIGIADGDNPSPKKMDLDKLLTIVN